MTAAAVATRHSAHTARARLVPPGGVVIDTGEVTAELNLDEGLSPYGDATVTVASTPALLAATDLMTARGLRLVVELSESVGDPVVVAEITRDHTGSVANLTAAYGPALSPAKITATYFVPWNPADVRAGSVLRANLLVTGREVDYTSGQVTFTAATDEARLEAYKLVSIIPETSGVQTVRATVNYALAKIGAALIPGPEDAPIAEAEAIIWEPGVSAWDYVRNVAEAAGLVVRCDERRRWTLTQRDAVLPDVVALTQFTDATEQVVLDDDRWGDAVVIHYVWTDQTTGEIKVRYDVASLVSEPLKVITLERDTPYPGPGAATYWLNRVKARGRILALESVGNYTIRPGMGFTASLPDVPAAYGYVEAITWQCPDDHGRIRTRGAGTVNPNAIDLWPVGLKIDALAGKIDALAVTGV